MNIALFPIRYLPYAGGVELTTYHLAKELLKRKHNPCIITRHKEGNSTYCEYIDGVKTYRLHFFTLESPPKSLRHKIIRFVKIIARGPRDLYALYRLLRNFDVHIVNIQFIAQSAFYILLVSYLVPFKLVVTLQSYCTKKFSAVTKIDKWVFKKVLERADYVTACSKAILEDAQKRSPHIKGKSRVIPNGVDLEIFRRGGSVENLGRYILSLGRLVPKKGFDMLIMGFKEVLDNGYDINLLIAGDGEARGYYERFARLLKIEERIIFYGNADREDVGRLFNGCEFFVLPSRIEPFGIVNLEAMAAGKAIVATRVGGISEIVRDEENGILVEPTDRGLANGIMRLLDDENLRNKLGLNGRKIIESGRFSWERIADEYLEVYLRTS